MKFSVTKAQNLLFALIDSTGLKVYGQGEWHVKMHKASQRRTWRKLHVMVDPVHHQIIQSSLTSSTTSDAHELLAFLNKIPSTIKRLWGDGAYDAKAVYEALAKKQIKPVIPPSRNATPCYHYRGRPHLGKSRLYHKKPDLIQRDIAITYMNQFPDPEEGRRRWKQHSFYHLRSLVETAMMRFKQTFSDKLRSRTFENQQAEARIKCLILNKMMDVAATHTSGFEAVT